MHARRSLHFMLALPLLLIFLSSAALAENEAAPVAAGKQAGGCCGGPKQANAALWKQVAPDSPAMRTALAVDNLTCSACLANIEANLRELPGTLGMRADLGSKQVMVLHEPALAASRIAESITGLGYPATVRATESGTAAALVAAAPANRPAATPQAQSGWQCAASRNQTPCTATLSSWQQFFSKYFGWLVR